jgi:hypothetical protein
MTMPQGESKQADASLIKFSRSANQKQKRCLSSSILLF